MKQINIAPIIFSSEHSVWATVDISSTTNEDINNMVGSTINGVLITTDTRVLLTAQTIVTDNGIYVNNIRAPDYYAGMRPYGILIKDVRGAKFWITDSQKDDILGLNPFSYRILLNIGSNTVGQLPTAELYFNGNYTVALSSSNSAYKLAPNTTLIDTPAGYWSQANGAITWLGSASTNILCTFSINATCNPFSSTDITFYFYINNAVVPNFETTQSFRFTNDKYMLNFRHVLTVHSTDSISVWVKPGGNNRNITVFNYSLVLQAVKTI